MERLYRQPFFPIMCPDSEFPHQAVSMMIHQKFLWHGTLAIKVEDPEFFRKIKNVFILDQCSHRKIRVNHMSQSSFY